MGRRQVPEVVAEGAARGTLDGPFDGGGQRLLRPLSDKTPVAPPLISTGNNIWDITGNDISVFNHDGSLAWNRDVYLDKRAEINPVLYNNDLVLVNGDKMEFITAEGETAFVYIQAGECFQTPIVYDGKIHYYIGGKNGLYLIESK